MLNALNAFSSVLDEGPRTTGRALVIHTEERRETGQGRVSAPWD
jgi:hypothetical protein